MPDPDHDSVLTQFNRLIEELLTGNLNRSKFQPWEIDILVDMASCELRPSQCVTILREYQTAVAQRIREGARVPLKLSEYLELQRTGSQPSRRARATGPRGSA
jgi:hypothetical protein